MMRRRSGGQAVGRSAVLLVALFGCRTAGRPSAGPGADSAGVAVVTSTAPLLGAGHELALADSPTVVLKGFLAIVGAVRLHDGRIVVASAQPPSLQYFAADGRPLYVAGGPEDANEALRSVMRVSVGRNDTVVAFDFARRGLYYYDANGGAAGMLPLPDPGGAREGNGYLPKGIAPDGRLIVQRDETPYPFPGAAGEVLPDSTRIFWYSRQQGLADSSPRLFEGENFGFDATTASGRNSMRLPLARPLAPMLRVVPGPDGVWFGDGRSWEVRRADARGTIDRVVRLERPIEPLTPVFRDSFVARFRTGRLGTDPRGLDRQFAAKIDLAPFPATLPAFIDLLVGGDSTLWLQHAGLLEGFPGDETLVWTVIGSDGKWLGDITMPPHFRPTAVGAGWVLGALPAPGGSQQVRLYALKGR